MKANGKSNNYMAQSLNLSQTETEISLKFSHAISNRFHNFLEFLSRHFFGLNCTKKMSKAEGIKL